MPNNSDQEPPLPPELLDSLPLPPKGSDAAKLFKETANKSKDGVLLRKVHIPDPPPLPPGLDVFSPINNSDDDDSVTGAEARELHRLLVEQAKRKIDALNLYEPLPLQDDFHSTDCRIRLLRGSNRSGKTLSSMVEVARMATGRDPWLKYPSRDGRAYIVGKDLKHIGEVIYPKLFKAGAFKIIRDTVTNEWRAYRPWQDEHRKKESKPAPPLIPPRMVKSIAWEQKAKSIISKCTLINGWELLFLSSLGKPPQGADLDAAVFDEEIVDSEWFPEMSARLLDREGHFWWGATPQAGTDRLYEIHLRCEREWEDYKMKVGPTPTAREYVILLADNPHILEEQKRALAADLDDTAHSVRIGGEFALLSSKVYPEFAKKLHLTPYFEIPSNWTRYAAVDPGRQICAVLFLAVPPSGDPKEHHVFLYDELYIPECDAEKFGDQFSVKVSSNSFESFVIDNRMGRQTQISTGKTIEEHYSLALEKRRVTSRATGSGFEWGSDDVGGGIEACRNWLRLQPATGRPRLQVMEDKCENFLWEIARYRYKRLNGMVIDTPEDRGRVHLMACFRYLSMADPRWVEPGAKKSKLGGAYLAFLAKKRQQKAASGISAVVFGPRRG